MKKINTRLNIINKPIGELHPYAKNPRNNDAAVDPVAASIERYGFKQPIVVDASGEIICGHTRYRAAQKLGLKTVPVVVADDLTPAQVRAFRIADNKVAELAQWNPELLVEELLEIPEEPMELFGFEDIELLDDEAPDWFETRKRYDNSGLEDESEEYQEFVDKFEQKRTSDDCYTPDIIYDSVAEWVAKEYGLPPENYCRPFFPGGDYETYDYTGKTVVDNPPFSIMSEIVRFYTERDIPFFIFAPSLTLFSAAVQAPGVCTITASASITYENGAVVKTSFITNLEPKNVRVRTAPELTASILEANKKNLAAQHKQLPKYEYPDHILTAAMAGRWSEIGIDYRLMASDCVRIGAMDEQLDCGKAIFGGGYLLSEKAAAEKAAAEKAAAEKAAAEKAAAEKWALSEREWAIVKTLGGKEAAPDGN